jgi:hypothetical protein
VGGCHSSIAEQQVFKLRGEGINGCSPPLICTAVRGAKGRFKVVKVVLRVAYVDGRIVERDVVGAINIGLKYLYSDGSPVALGSTGAHEVRVEASEPTPRPNPANGNTVSGETLHRPVDLTFD